MADVIESGPQLRPRRATLLALYFLAACQPCAPQRPLRNGTARWACTVDALARCAVNNERRGHAPGTRLRGSLHNTESLRQRSVVDKDEDGGCWHLRMANGRPLPDDHRHVLWVHGRGHMTATRAAWFFATGKDAPPRWRVVRTCASYDCVRYEHLQAVTKQRHGALLARAGRSSSPRKTIANRINGAQRSRVTAELHEWLHESEQSAVELAPVVGLCKSYIAWLRANPRAAVGLQR
jgi:hypothetical protein